MSEMKAGSRQWTVGLSRSFVGDEKCMSSRKKCIKDMKTSKQHHQVNTYSHSLTNTFRFKVLSLSRVKMHLLRAPLTSLLASSLVAASDCTTNTSLPMSQAYYPPAAECWEYRVPVTITSENLVFDFPDWKDDYSLQDFLTALTTRPSAHYPSPIVGTKNETATYTLAASFCTPRKQVKKTIIFATHGIGQARTHWNSAYEPDKYTFVQHAIDQGYSIWFYDRLGTGESEK